MLQIHNTLTGRKEPFRPLVEGEVRMYVCGMTVYDLCHLGHARVFVVFDVETVFLFPWALSLNALPLFAVLEGILFIAILVVGLVFTWRKGLLEWA